MYITSSVNNLTHWLNSLVYKLLTWEIKTLTLNLCEKDDIMMDEIVGLYVTKIYYCMTPII